MFLLINQYEENPTWMNSETVSLSILKNGIAASSMWYRKVSNAMS